MQTDLAANKIIVQGRSNLAPVQNLKELRNGFSISDPVPFVKAGVLKVSTLNTWNVTCELTLKIWSTKVAKFGKVKPSIDRTVHASAVIRRF